MHPIINIALRAAREASTLLVQAHNRLDRVKVFEKGVNDIVTDVDRTVEETLIHHLRKAYPEHSFLAEESGNTPGSDKDTLWIIDPIDGTHNFVLGLPHFCISMACVQRGKLQHALIIDPIKGDEFIASKGGGAQLNGNRIRVGTRAKLDGGTISLSCAGPLPQQEQMLALQQRLLGTAGRLRISGSTALDMAYVAAGRLDAGWTCGVKPWDSAAGILLIQEAGGLVSDLSGNPDCLYGDTLIYGNPKCFKTLLKLAGGAS
ncbi:MAG: inositol monophosphatase [Pseudomonadales bacterium]|nr:inositol monophosphatase [Pseudomonadales bacterium]